MGEGIEDLLECSSRAVNAQETKPYRKRTLHFSFSIYTVRNNCGDFQYQNPPQVCLYEGKEQAHNVKNNKVLVLTSRMKDLVIVMHEFSHKTVSVL